MSNVDKNHENDNSSRKKRHRKRHKMPKDSATSVSEQPTEEEGGGKRIAMDETMKKKEKREKKKKLKRARENDEHEVEEEGEEHEIEEEDEEKQQVEEAKEEVKNRGSGIMSTESFESLPISENTMKAIKDMNFEYMTQVDTHFYDMSWNCNSLCQEFYLMLFGMFSLFCYCLCSCKVCNFIDASGFGSMGMCIVSI